MKKILIAEDDELLLAELVTLLAGAGYETAVVGDFTNATNTILASDANLLLLDINLPGLNGEEILRQLRKASDIPVIMVTSRTSEADEVLSMSYGADDYITKPYNPTILLLRIAAVLKRQSGETERISWRNLPVDVARGVIGEGKEEVILTKNEMIIFCTLLFKQGKIVSRDELMTALWDNEEYINDNALSVNISRLRGKLAEIGIPDAIDTRKKQGYILQ